MISEEEFLSLKEGDKILVDIKKRYSNMSDRCIIGTVISCRRGLLFDRCTYRYEQYYYYGSNERTAIRENILCLKEKMCKDCMVKMVCDYKENLETCYNEREKK